MILGFGMRENIYVCMICQFVSECDLVRFFSDKLGSATCNWWVVNSEPKLLVPLPSYAGFTDSHCLRYPIEELIF